MKFWEALKTSGELFVVLTGNKLASHVFLLRFDYISITLILRPVNVHSETSSPTIENIIEASVKKISYATTYTIYIYQLTMYVC